MRETVSSRDILEALPPRDAVPASTSRSAPATSIKRRHLTLPPLPHPPLINGLPTAIERVQGLEEFLLLPERMRGGGGGSGLGFGGVLVEEEGEEVASAPERPMRRRRRRWGVEVDDGYSPSSTGGGGSSCCDSFGCDSVGPGSSLLSLAFLVLSFSRTVDNSSFFIVPK